MFHKQNLVLPQNFHDEFYIGPNGEKKKKAALGDLKEVCLPSFLLGVWHYVVMNRRDNAVGKKTYDVWCPSNDRAPRKYTAHMGEGLLDSLTTYTVDTKETITAEVVDEPIEDDASEAAGQDIGVIEHALDASVNF